MPYEITFDGMPGGYSINAAREGEEVQLQCMEFISTEDGQDFIKKLEGMPDDILNRLPNGVCVNRSQIDHLLAIIRRDLTATVYINELPVRLGVRASRDVKAGQRIVKDDIADIAGFELEGITIPEEAGVVFVFSSGWRKGMFYDLTPLQDDTCTPRAFDIGSMLAQVYTHLVFQDRFSITDAEWETLFGSQWFPFIGLRNRTVEDMLAYIRAGWSVDELTSRIVGEVKVRLPDFLRAWGTHPLFAEHLPILRRAAERFLADDFISCTGLLFPRIEGLMRAHHAAVGCTEKPGHKSLPASAVRPNLDREKCLLLPQRFQRYLETVYFANFTPGDASIAVSRHSVGHGVASPEQFNEKAAVIGLLVVNQLFFCFERPTAKTECVGSGAGSA